MSLIIASFCLEFSVLLVCILTPFFFRLFWLSVLVFFVFVILFLVFFPIFVRPWDLILSNKRLILRTRYWNIGRLSQITSFNLVHLDTQAITPRIKILPLTLGFLILSSISIPLFEFALTGAVPLPVLVALSILIINLFGLLPFNPREVVESNILKLLSYISPFEVLFAAGITIFGIILLISGLPRRKSVVLSSKGQHKLTINVGFPVEMSNYLYGIARKQIPKIDPEWTWDVPLLEDEKVVQRGHIALINSNQLFFGLLSIITIYESVLTLPEVLLSLTLENWAIPIFILILNLATLFFILLSVVFAKRHLRIVATDHRIIFQEERRSISGLYGKRVYQYIDIPFDNVQGFSYSNFTGFSSGAFLIFIFIFLLGLATSIYFENPTLQIISIIILVMYLLIDYKTFTSMRITSASGQVIDMSYRLPYLINLLAHRLEKNKWVYSKLFPNILSEEETSSILNQIRGVQHPVSHLDKVDVHEVTYNAFVEKSDKPIGVWRRLAPFKFAKLSVLLGFILGSLSVIFITISLPENLRIGFAIIGFSVMLITTLNGVIFIRNSILLYKTRIFRVQETRPYKIALLLGTLPFRDISEISSDFIAAIRYRLAIIGKFSEAFVQTIIIAIGVAFYFNFQNISLVPFGSIFLFIFFVIFVGYIPIWIRSLAKLIPQYSFTILVRYRKIVFPFHSNTSEIITALKEVSKI